MLSKMFIDVPHKTPVFYQGWKEVISLPAWLPHTSGLLGMVFLSLRSEGTGPLTSVFSFFTRPFLLSLFTSHPLTSFHTCVLTRLSFLASAQFVKSHDTFRSVSEERRLFKRRV